MSSLAMTVATFQSRDVVRTRWLAAYVVFFALVTEGLLRFAGGDARAMLSLTSVVLYVVPLVTLVFGTVYLYNAREFTELLLAMGLRSFSMHPSQIASIKQRVLRTDVRRWAGRIDAVLDADDPEARFREATRA